MFSPNQSDTLKLGKLSPQTGKKYALTVWVSVGILLVTLAVIAATTQLFGNLQEHSDKVTSLTQIAYDNDKETGSDPAKNRMGSLDTQSQNPYMNSVWLPKTRELFEKGHAAMYVNAFPEAIADFSKAVATCPEESSAPIPEKPVLTSDGKPAPARALRYRNQANAQRQELEQTLLARIYQCRAYCYMKMHKYRLGIDDLTKSIEHNTDNSLNRKNLLNRAEAYRMIGRKDLAEDDMHHAEAMPE